MTHTQRSLMVANVKVPFPVIFSVLPKLFCKRKLPSVSTPLLGGIPASPTTVPPTLYVTAGQLTATLVTLAVAVPLAVLWEIVQVCVGPVGCAKIVIV